MRILALFLANLAVNGIANYTLFRLVLHHMGSFSLGSAYRKRVALCAITVLGAVALVVGEYLFASTSSLFLLLQGLFAGVLLAYVALWRKAKRLAKM